MNSVLKFLSGFALLVALFFAGSTANAQPVLPPEGTPIVPPSKSSTFESSVPLQGQATVEATNLQLGEPGLSFRYVGTFGVKKEPYLADNTHLYGPAGLFVDDQDQVYITEALGQRLLRYDSNGVNNLILGHAGLPFHHDDFLSGPKDIAVDNEGNIWVVFFPTVKKFSPSGEPLLTIPAQNPWESGNDDYHFNDPFGIAFDQDGRLFVSDTNNHRIQVYDVSGDQPTYLFTIGVTGEPKDDNTGFNHPFHIGFDSQNRLYVVDGENYRVQRCTKDTETPETWSCNTFYGVTGEPGFDLEHMDFAHGIAIRGTDVFIADSNNFRVLKCNLNGECNHFAGSGSTRERGWDDNHFWWPEDVAVDSNGNVYVSDYDNHRVQKFDVNGNLIATLGEPRVPYLTDNQHLNQPWGIAVASDGSLYVTERNGYRLLKLSPNGSLVWAKGQPGIYATNQNDFAHYGSWWIGLEGNPAVDSQGNLYVADAGQNRILVYGPDGNFARGVFNFGYGPTAIAIQPGDGRLAVAYVDEHVVRVYDRDFNLIDTFGESNVPGSDAIHLSEPRGVAFSQNGTLYIADAGNHRILECIWYQSRYWCRIFAGESGVPGDDFGHLGHPLSVAVDSAGRVFVADEWNNRVQVFNSAGAYLTTIGGEWGSNTSQFIGVSGVAVDAQGNVYVTDRHNHRIQKFAPGVPGWKQVNVNGFGTRRNRITSLATFGNNLYAGTYFEEGAQIWRMNSLGQWSKIIDTGFGNPANIGIDHMLEFNGCLYAGTWADGTNGGELWRTCDGTRWEQVVAGGFGDATNGEIIRLGVYEGQLYAATWSYTDTHGTEVWRSSSGNAGTWERVVENGWGDPTNWAVISMENFNGALYASTLSSIGEFENGAEIWRFDGENWSNITPTELVNDDITYAITLKAFNGYLYAGVAHNGAEIWRCSQDSGCDAPEDWQKLIGAGFGNPNNTRVDGFQIFEGRLYAITSNYNQGSEIWSSRDGVEWAPSVQGGFGDSNNVNSYWGSATAVYQNSLYIGTYNYAYSNGGQIWQMLYQVYLPLVRR